MKALEKAWTLHIVHTLVIAPHHLEAVLRIMILSEASSCCDAPKRC